MSYKTTWENEGIFFKFTGDIGLEEINEANNEAYPDDRFKDIKYFIWDMTDVKNLELNEIKTEIDDIVHSAITDKVASLSKPSLKGALIGKDKDVRKTIEYYIAASSILKSSWKLKLFINAESARKWINS